MALGVMWGLLNIFMGYIKNNVLNFKHKQYYLLQIITQTFRTYTIITIKQVDDSDIGPYTAKIFNSVSEVNTGFNLCIKGT